MRSPVFIVAVIALTNTACSAFSSDGIWHVAVGARGTLSPIYGPCDPLRASTAGSVTLGSGEHPTFAAMASGRTRIPCRDGAIVLDVRAPSRIDIDIPPVVSQGRRYLLRARVYDAHGVELDLGDSAEMVWTLAPPLREVDQRSEFVALSGPSSASTAFVADAAGEARVGVTFGALHTNAMVRVQ